MQYAPNLFESGWFAYTPIEQFPNPHFGNFTDVGQSLTQRLFSNGFEGSAKYKNG